MPTERLYSCCNAVPVYLKISLEHQWPKGCINTLLSNFYSIHTRLKIHLYILSIFTTRKRSLGQGTVFTPVCHSVHALALWEKQTPMVGRQTPLYRDTPSIGSPTSIGRSPSIGRPRIQSSGQYASYWNAPLLVRLSCLYLESAIHCFLF